MDRRRKNFLARGGLASADEMLDALASGVAGDEAGVMGEIDNEPGGSGTAGVSASASGGDGVVGVRSVRPTAAASGEMVWQWIVLETALGRPWGRHELRQISQLLGLRMGLVLGVMVWNLRQMGL